MDDFIEHTCVEGERWDQLAARYYGDAFAYERLITANRHLPIVPVLSAGWVVRVPLVDDSELPVLAPELLPPWKRSAAS